MKIIPITQPIIIPYADGTGKAEIDPVDYAIRRNGNLGINDAGKTYAAGYMAEQLMKRGIPIVVISPSPNSPWRYLKIPKPGREGFPVVVVGENADLPLDPDHMKEIMLAAMEEGINIVFDLHASSLSEAARRRITTAIVDTMYWKNQHYGLRHCFLEEVANYAPQNLNDKITYGAVERFAREGGNAKVGITMLNPRAESVNKNLLELCSSLFLFQQTGRNSLKNLKKFFDMLDTHDRNLIVKSFPRLIKGRAWYWEAIGAIPVEIQFPEKDTEHPNRRALATDAGIPIDRAVDVTTFVSRMSKALAKKVPVEKDIFRPAGWTGDTLPEKSTTLPKNDGMQAALFEAQQKIIELEQALAREKEKVRNANNAHAELFRRFTVVQEMLRPDYEKMQQIFGEIHVNGSSPASSVDRSKYDRWFPKLTGYQKDMLEAFIEHQRLTPDRLGLLIGKKVKGNGTFEEYVRVLKRFGLIRDDGNELVLVEL